MYVRVVTDPAVVASTTAALLREEGRKVMQGRDTYNLALPTGSTPVEAYREFVRQLRNSPAFADFIRRIRTWNLDEYLPDDDREVWRYHEQSYWLFMHRHLFGHLPFAPGANHVLDPTTTDPEEECRQYEEGIAAQGGLDLALVGIGTNGHVAFNEPKAPKDSRTGVVRLAWTTVSDNAKKFFGGNLEAVPKHALSMGCGTILAARRVALIATGHAKAVAIWASVLGPVTGWCPASFFQEHADCTYILDIEAASLLLREGLRLNGSPEPGTYTVKSESDIDHTIQIVE